jgi:hypothetical protein
MGIEVLPPPIFTQYNVSMPASWKMNNSLLCSFPSIPTSGHGPSVIQLTEKGALRKSTDFMLNSKPQRKGGIERYLKDVLVGSMAQIVEHLPNNPEALNSIPVPPKRKKQIKDMLVHVSQTYA